MGVAAGRAARPDQARRRAGPQASRRFGLVRAGGALASFPGQVSRVEPDAQDDAGTFYVVSPPWGSARSAAGHRPRAVQRCLLARRVRRTLPAALAPRDLAAARDRRTRIATRRATRVRGDRSRLRRIHRVVGALRTILGGDQPAAPPRRSLSHRAPLIE